VTFKIRQDGLTTPNDARTFQSENWLLSHWA